MPGTVPSRAASLVGGCVSIAIALFGIVMTAVIFTGNAPVFLAVFSVSFVAMALVAAGVCINNLFSRRAYRDFKVVTREEVPDPLARIQVNVGEPDDMPLETDPPPKHIDVELIDVEDAEDEERGRGSDRDPSEHADADGTAGED